MLYLVITHSPSSEDMRIVNATDLADLAQKIKQDLGQGLSINADQREPLTITIVNIQAAAQITPDADGSQAQIQTTNQAQAAIADLPTNNTISNVAQAQTAINLLATKLDAILAAMRANGHILR